MQIVIMIYYTGATIRISIKLVDNGNEEQVGKKLDGVNIVVESSSAGIMALHPDSVRESFMISSSRKKKKKVTASESASPTDKNNESSSNKAEVDDDDDVNVRHNIDGFNGNDNTDDDDDDNVSQQSGNSKERSEARSKEATSSIATTSRRTTAEELGGPGSQQLKQSFTRPHTRQQILEQKQLLNQKKKQQELQNPLAAVFEAVASEAAAKEEIVGVGGVTTSPKTKVRGWKDLFKLNPQERRDMIDLNIKKRNSKANTKNQYQDDDEEIPEEEGSEPSQRKEADQDEKLPLQSSELQKQQQRHQWKFDKYQLRPSFESIVKDGNVKQNVIIGDPQFLLDFAIIGHGTFT